MQCLVINIFPFGAPFSQLHDYHRTELITGFSKFQNIIFCRDNTVFEIADSALYGSDFWPSGKKSEIFPSPPLCRPDIGGQGDLKEAEAPFYTFYSQFSSLN